MMEVSDTGELIGKAVTGDVAVGVSGIAGVRTDVGVSVGVGVG